MANFAAEVITLLYVNAMVKRMYKNINKRKFISATLCEKLY